MIKYLIQLVQECAKESLESGLKISDKSLLQLDFSIPPAPNKKQWTKKLAMHEFKNDRLTEEKLGYILAKLEYEYNLTVWSAEDRLHSGEINKAEFDKLEKEAKQKWQG